MKRVCQLLDFMANHPDTKIKLCASDMILNVHSEASYLSASKCKSRAGGYFSSEVYLPTETAEAELGAVFDNTKEARIL